MTQALFVVGVALGSLLIGGGMVGLAARYFFLLGWEKAHDDRRLEPGAVGELPPPAPRPVGETSGRHHKPQASDGPPPDEVWSVPPVWPGDEDTQVIPAEEVRA